MKFSTIATALATLCWEVAAQQPNLGPPPYPSTDQATFNTLYCAVGVASTYYSGCAKSQVTDKCGVVWEQIYTFDISDQYGGVVPTRYFRKKATNELVLLYDGSKSVSNFIADGQVGKTTYTFNNKCPSCQLENGFFGVYNGSRAQIINTTKYLMAANPGYKLVVMGTSLGAAIAAITFADFLSFPENGLTPVNGLGIGQPRTGNGVWAAYMNSLAGSTKWMRLTHECDAVPQILPPRDGWLHHSPEIWAVDDNSNGIRPSAATTYLCPLGAFGGENPNCINSCIYQSIPDHAMYPGAPSSEEAVC